MIIAVTLLKWPCSLQEHNDRYLMDSSRSELGVIFVRALLNCAPDYQQTAREGGGGGGVAVSWQGDWSRDHPHHHHPHQQHHCVLNGPGMLFRHFVHFNTGF